MDETQQQIDKVLNTVRYSRVLPIWRFALLSIVTLGIYNIIWFYKTWNMLAAELKLQILPLVRALLQIFFIIPLGIRLKQFLLIKGIEPNFNPIYLGIAFIAIIIFPAFLSTPFALIVVFTFVPLIPMVEALNVYYTEQDKELSVKPFSKVQIIFICVGAVFFAAVVFSILTMPPIIL
jgi:hypothetical protein